MTATKGELRQQIRAALKLISPEEARQNSAAACALLREQRVWREARAVLFYAPLAGEIDLTLLWPESIAAGKIIALPRFIPETGTYDAFQIMDAATHCAPGKYGILEPLPHCPRLSLKQLDLALVPGVGFDAAGNRLGRGRGFYDRLLSQITGSKCGVAFDQQIVAKIPGETHDVPMNCILTPTRWRAVPESWTA